MRLRISSSTKSSRKSSRMPTWLTEHKHDVRRALVLDAVADLEQHKVFSQELQNAHLDLRDFLLLGLSAGAAAAAAAADLHDRKEEILAQRVEQRNLGVGVHAELQGRLGRRRVLDVVAVVYVVALEHRLQARSHHKVRLLVDEVGV